MSLVCADAAACNRLTTCSFSTHVVVVVVVALACWRMFTHMMSVRIAELTADVHHVEACVIPLVGEGLLILVV